MVDGNELDNMLTIKEVSRLLHVHPNTLRRWSDDGILNACRITSRGDRRWRQEDVIKLLDRFSNQGSTEKAN
jgi:excisionase family DNA binding protein